MYDLLESEAMKMSDVWNRSSKTTPSRKNTFQLLDTFETLYLVNMEHFKKEQTC